MKRSLTTIALGLLSILWLASGAHSTVYDVGPGRALSAIGEVPWESLNAGDTVRIFWREEPYAEKWVIARQGTEDAPITVSGVPNSDGDLPVIDGRDATTRSVLNFWNEERGVIKVGGSNVPADITPQYIVIENLDIRSGRPPYSFTGRSGRTDYRSNAAAVYLEKGDHITIRNCVLRDCGNGLFSASQSTDVLVESCYLYDNGIEGSIFEHNNYTESDGIIFQYNRFGPLRDDCGGNNLKDRSTGLVVRYNWIKGGNRQLDLVDTDHFMADPKYRSTYVYGNVLVEFDGEGNSQVAHYGGDSGDLSRYRKGTLFFHNNTVVSTRSGNTTLVRLSSAGETADLRNNILYTTVEGNRFALLNGDGAINLRNNWLKTGWRNSHDAAAGSVVLEGGNIEGTAPGFTDLGAGRYGLSATSPCIDGGTSLASDAAGHEAAAEYVVHRAWRLRASDETVDVGAYEFVSSRSDFDGDGRVDFDDFLMFVAAYGRTESHPEWDSRYDLGDDGKIGFDDFLMFVGTFGRTFSMDRDDGVSSLVMGSYKEMVL